MEYWWEGREIVLPVLRKCRIYLRNHKNLLDWWRGAPADQEEWIIRSLSGLMNLLGRSWVCISLWWYMKWESCLVPCYLHHEAAYYSLVLLLCIKKPSRSICLNTGTSTDFPMSPKCWGLFKCEKYLVSRKILFISISHTNLF